MNRHPILFTLGALAALIGLSTAADAQVIIQTVPVGFAGNDADTNTGSLYGAVPYNYSIGTYDVTDAQYAAFLTAKAATADPYGLWNSLMDPTADAGLGGIARSGPGPYTYSVATGYANKPVIGASWYDAVRFVNWLQNGKGDGDTESGTYAITGGGSNSGMVAVPGASMRGAWAAAGQVHWLLPSENEWYKAAYYNPVAQEYYAYPFQSDASPAAAAPPGTANSGNFLDAGFNSDGFDSYLTDVGSYLVASSPFRAFDMGGDATQWTDEFVAGTSYVVRGGAYAGGSSASAASDRSSDNAANSDVGLGFRVASVGSPVPEPASLTLVAVAVALFCLRRRLTR